MVQAPQRTAFSGPALIRLLARLSDADVAESRQSLSDRLSQWLHWTDAIALSTALNGHPAAAPLGEPASGRAEEQECARVRTALANAIAGDGAAGQRGRKRVFDVQAPTQTALDYAVFRQRHLSLQQAMETDIGALRSRLRATLAAGSPGMAKLAVVDAVMERALAPRERSLLAAAPVLLGKHFERLRQAGESPENAATPAPNAPTAWLDVFRKDMQSVLLAELDVRFQPVEGLLSALRTR